MDYLLKKKFTMKWWAEGLGLWEMGWTSPGETHDSCQEASCDWTAWISRVRFCSNFFMCPWDSGHVHQLSSPEKGRNTSTLLMNALELLLIQTVFGKRNALDQAGWKRWCCYPSAETIRVITKCIFKDTDTSVLTAGILLGHKVLESLCGFQNQTG